MKNISSFSVGDKVNTPFGEGEVWKVTDRSVHVKHWHGKKNCPFDWLFSKYLIETTHHSQNSISKLSIPTPPASNDGE